MLVPAMNNKELKNEIFEDNDILWSSSTIKRLSDEYHRERFKLKIKKEEIYPRYYEVKTKTKNHWLIKISKHILVQKYQCIGDSEVLCFAYYYSSSGIRIFNTHVNGQIMVFNKHLFNRYNERMNLAVPNLLDVVKVFFNTNINVNYQLMPREDGGIKFFGLVQQGFLMGEFIQELNWFENKTFISKETANRASNEFETDFLDKVLVSLYKIDQNKEPMKYYELMKIYRALMVKE
jgi:hypothetical protein